MTDVLRQFHALRTELLPVIAWSIKELGVHATALRLAPLKSFALGSQSLDARVMTEDIREIAFTLDAPVELPDTVYDFVAKNRGALVLSIGKHSDDALGESALASRGADELALKTWRKIARRLSNILQTGGVIVNPRTGATSSANWRFTAGAKELSDAGVRMLPVAGSNYFKF